MLKVCVLWALVIPATAQVYKWVDEKGVTHYGERPPQGAKAQEVEQRLANPGPAPEKAAQPSWKEQDLEFRRRRIENEQAETKQKQTQDAKRQACNQARDQLAQTRSARRLYRLDEKGERVFQSDDERNALIARLEQLTSERCR
ncbi:MAG TPA: DUF4124 domain-containing protein [Burkholderiales bacterium]